MSSYVTLKIFTYFERLGIPYRQVHHEPATTSEASARARGESLEIGGKAILLKTDEAFRLFVLSASRRINSGAIRRQLQVKKVRFASSDELFELTGLVPGSLPPFGVPILPFELFVDPSIVVNEEIAFNAGSLDTSIIMSIRSYISAANPKFLTFAS